MKLRCVLHSPDLADSELAPRAFEACDRAGVETVALEGDEDAVMLDGEEHEVRPGDGPVALVMRARGYRAEECIAVGAALRDAPVGAVWVGPLDLDVRGENVRVAEEDAELLYDAVIIELAERR